MQPKVSHWKYHRFHYFKSIYLHSVQEASSPRWRSNWGREESSGPDLSLGHKATPCSHTVFTLCTRWSKLLPWSYEITASPEDLNQWSKYKHMGRENDMNQRETQFRMQVLIDNYIPVENSLDSFLLSLSPIPLITVELFQSTVAGVLPKRIPPSAGAYLLSRMGLRCVHNVVAANKKNPAVCGRVNLSSHSKNFKGIVLLRILVHGTNRLTSHKHLTGKKV